MIITLADIWSFRWSIHVQIVVCLCSLFTINRVYDPYLFNELKVGAAGSNHWTHKEPWMTILYNAR